MLTGIIVGRISERKGKLNSSIVEPRMCVWSYIKIESKLHRMYSGWCISSGAVFFDTTIFWFGNEGRLYVGFFTAF